MAKRVDRRVGKVYFLRRARGPESGLSHDQIHIPTPMCRNESKTATRQLLVTRACLLVFVLGYTKKGVCSRLEDFPRSVRAVSFVYTSIKFSFYHISVSLGCHARKRTLLFASLV